MSRHEIQNAEPEGVRNRRLVDGMPTEQHTLGALNCPPSIESFELPPSNVAAKLAFACGIFGTLLVLASWIGLEMARHSRVYVSDVPIVGCGFIGALLGVLACFLAFCGLIRLAMRPASGGYGWALAGILIGLMTVVLFCVMFMFEAVAYAA